jgi:hypothetical protein
MIEIALACLAVFRTAELVTVDAGPRDLFLRFRIWAGVFDLGEDGRPKTNAGRLFECPYCIGMYLAFVAALIIAPFDWHLIFYWLGLAGGQAFLQSVGGRK